VINHKLPPVISYVEWKALESARVKQENAYYDSLNSFERLIDSHISYITILSISSIISFNLGFMIGFLMKV
jgi:hypothetical protein